MTRSIYIYSPSSAVRDKAAFRRGVARLKALGLTVEVDEAALASSQRFAGDVEPERARRRRVVAAGLRRDGLAVARGEQAAQPPAGKRSRSSLISFRARKNGARCTPAVGDSLTK